MRGGSNVGFSSDIVRAIQTIARRGLVDENGNLLDASETVGYVTKIHDDPEDDLFGTVDVQEYNVNSVAGEGGQGLHEGVFLSAIQDVTNGLLVVPKLHSDVVFTFDSISRREYIRMFSQVDIVKLEGGTNVSVGVIEREPYDPNGDVDVEDVEETGNKTWTEYTNDKIETIVADKDGNTVSIVSTSKDVSVNVGDSVSIVADQKNVDIKAGETTIHIEDGKVDISATDVSVKADGNVNIEASGNADIKSSSSTINSSKVQITGGMLTVNGVVGGNSAGPFCAIPVCPFSGAPHAAPTVSNT